MSSLVLAGLIGLAGSSLGLIILLVTRQQRAAKTQETAFAAAVAQLPELLDQTLTAKLTLRLAELGRQAREDAALARQEAAELAQRNREELGRRLDAVRLELATATKDGRKDIAASLDSFARQFELRSEALRQTVAQQLVQLQGDNAAKLEEMRRTVAEKLEGTLERRLGDSFRLVSERLELVHKGLGEMQTLAVGVGDLKKVMTNVKTRGTWGEIQLGSLLDQVLSHEQFERNVQTKSGSLGRVEYAIKMPHREATDRGPGYIWLPIDAKFPIENYHRLIDAQEHANPEAVEHESRLLEVFIKLSAKEICEKYLNPPETTDFAVMYLPTEGLFAEVARRVGLVEVIQREHRVVLAGPTTLGALLNSLQMGFRTLAIQKRSSEVWEILGAVKSEFGKFDEVLKKVEKKLQEAGSVIESVHTRSRVINKKLKAVQELPSADAARLLPLAEGVGADEEPASLD